MKLERLITKILNQMEPLEPLPTTRQLGDRFALSHVTIARVLRGMVDSGILWQAQSGRFYRAEAKEKLHRPRPVGCLVRSLSEWTAWYEGIMTGVGQGCESESRSILVHPVPDFVQQSGADQPSRFLSELRQKEVLKRFLDQDERKTERLLLDDCLSDSVITLEKKRLKLARLLLRPSPVKEIEAAYPDYQQGSCLGISHLLDRGYEHIIFVQPYPNYQTVRLFESEFTKAFQNIGTGNATYEVFQSNGALAFPDLIKKITVTTNKRTALFCPEDNCAVLLQSLLSKAGIAVPGSVGVLGAMGTKILNDSHISRLKVDFVILGQRAVTGFIPLNGGPCVEFSLEPDSTT